MSGSGITSTDRLVIAEVSSLTVGVQQALGKIYGEAFLPDMVERDPEVLDLVVGALLHHVS